MSKVIMFSRVFPAYHPLAGCDTYFVEKLWNSFNVFALKEEFIAPFDDDVNELNENLPFETINKFKGSLLNRVKFTEKKFHTIRAGQRFKVGDKFSPRVWSGKPYRSKQIIIAPDIEVKKTFDFHIRKNDYFINHSPVNYNQLKFVAANDGLEIDDFECWFNVKKGEVFAGQIICWNENINY